MTADQDSNTLHPDVVQKIMDDHNFPEELRSRLFDQVEVCESESEAEVTFNNFAANNRLCGLQQRELAEHEKVGHVKCLDGFSQYMARAAESVVDGEGMNEIETTINSNLEYLAGRGTSQDKYEAELWFDEYVKENLPDYKISGLPCWLFMDEGADDVASLLGSEEAPLLPARLGLPEPKLWGDLPYVYTKGIPFVGFCVPGFACSESRQPIALDGDYWSVKNIWAVGGNTTPLPHGPQKAIDLGGLNEIVALPINLFDCINEVYRFDNE